MNPYYPSEALLQYLKQVYVLDWQRGIHGFAHWHRVLQNGLLLAKRNGANQRVVTLFAFLHDIQREDDGYDLEHGERAKNLILSTIQPTHLHLPPAELELLTYACEFHTHGYTEGDVTVRTCWDADRLDLGRVGIVPDPKYLCTAEAKEEKILLEAYQRSLQQNRKVY